MLNRNNLLGLLICLLTITSPAQSAEKLPADSVYQLPVVLENQAGKEFLLAERRDRVQLVAMFYTSCQYVCPLIVDSAKATLRGLDDAERAKLDVLLVSFDPQRDTPAVLNAVAIQRKLPAAQWTLARTEESNVRKLAALLGIRYRELQDGGFNHTSALLVLDPQGRIVARTEKMGAPIDAEFLAKLKQALKPNADTVIH